MSNRNTNRNWDQFNDQGYGYDPNYYRPSYQNQGDANMENFGRQNRSYQGSSNRSMRGYSGQNQGMNRGYFQGNQGMSQGNFSNQGYGYDQDYAEYGYIEPDTWTYTEFWLIPGPYTGVGPKGYQRSDDRLEEEINDRLTQHGHLDASNINVDVKNGEATLNGTVNSRKEKRLAEDIADSVSGVQDVHNNLKITKQGQKNQAQQNTSGTQKKKIQSGELKTGMEVIGKKGQKIGTVKEIRNQDFLVDRSGARDIFIPFSACDKIDQHVHVNVPADQVDNQGWQQPDLVGSNNQNKSKNQ